MELWRSLLLADVQAPCLIWSAWIKVEPLGKSSSFEKLLLFPHCSAQCEKARWGKVQRPDGFWWCEVKNFFKHLEQVHNRSYDQKSRVIFYHTATQTE